MNLSPSWVQVLDLAGIEAVHWSSLGSVTSPDPEIMSFASVHGYVVLTRDLDFSAILAASGDAAPSVVQLRSGSLPIKVLEGKVVAALKQLTAELEGGALLSISPKRLKLRPLPIIR